MTESAFERVRRSLDEYDRDDVASKLLDLVERRLATDVDHQPEWDPTHPGAATTVGNLANDLRNVLGDWYFYGPIVGDETVTGFCWCHSPQKAASKAPVGHAAEGVTDALMEQVDRMHAWRVGILETIESAIEDGMSEEDALVAVVERVIELGIWDAWYWNAATAARLLVEAAGRTVSDTFLESLTTLTETKFTSWSEPTSESIFSFAEEAAWAIVEAELDARNTE